MQNLEREFRNKNFHYVQEHAEDILVPPLLRNCLTLNDISYSPYFCFSVLSPEQWSLQ